MAIDMKGFHEMFFAESEEFLDLARAQLDSGAADISELHRYAHSIKGGADTFGFTDTVALASVLERLLQGVKDGRLRMDGQITAATREAFVALREQLSALSNGRPIGPGTFAATIARLSRIHEACQGTPTGTEVPAVSPVFDLRFAIGRTVVGSDVLVEDMLASLVRLGEILSVHRPQASDADQFWHISVASIHTLGELRAVLERIAEPDSLSVVPRTGGGQADVPDPADVDPLSERAGAISRSRPIDAVGDRDEASCHPYVTFLVGAQLYAVQAGTVIETRPHDNVTRMAGLPDWILGVVPFGDDFVPVLDLRVLLGVDEAWQPGPIAQLCVKADGCAAALAVDDILGVMSLARHCVRPVPNPTGGVARYIEGLAVDQNRVLVVLDLPALLSAARVHPVRDVALVSRLEKLNAMLDCLRADLQAGGGGAIGVAADEPDPAPGGGKCSGPLYHELLDYVEDAIGTGRAVLSESRDLDHGLRYPEQARSLVVVLLGWIAEMLIGLDRYLQPPADMRGLHDVGQGVFPRQEAGLKRTGKGRQGGAGPLPKVGGGARADRSIAQEWESNKK